MATTKIVLRTQKLNGKGESPLYLRITKSRKTHFVSFGLYILEKDWDPVTCKVKKSHRNSARLNAFISQKTADAEALIVDSAVKIQPITSRKLRDKIVGIEPVDFFEFSKRYINALLEGNQIATYKRANAVITKLKTFNNDKPLYLDTINHIYLEDFERYCASKLNNRTNTIHGNLRIIRKVINDAIRDDKMSRDDNPFLKMTLKTENTRRNFLLEEELNTIEGLDLSRTPGYRLTRDLFVFACYAGGIRISDLLVLKWKNVVDGRLLIRMKKTGGIQMVKLPNKALDILEIFKTEGSNPEDYVFPYVTCEQDIDTPLKLHNYVGKKTALINNNLKEIAGQAKISKKVTFHVSRHTFATIALRKGMRIEYVSKLLGHSDLKETQIYAKVINEELDKAMDVFND
jgi:integrase/recombinase XerD